MRWKALAGSGQARPDVGWMPITKRQREVLGLIAQGKTLKEISMLMRISLLTVKNHSANLQQRLQARSISQAVYLAAKSGMI